MNSTESLLQHVAPQGYEPLSLPSCSARHSVSNRNWVLIAMAVIHTLLALSSFAVVLTAGTVSSSGPSAGRTRLRHIHCHANSAPQAHADRWRQRVCRGDRMKRREFIALSIGGHGVGYAL